MGSAENGVPIGFPACVWSLPPVQKNAVKSSIFTIATLESVNVFDPLRERNRDLHVSIRIGAAYVHWVRVFIRLHGLR